MYGLENLVTPEGSQSNRKFRPTNFPVKVPTDCHLAKNFGKNSNAKTLTLFWKIALTKLANQGFT